MTLFISSSIFPISLLKSVFAFEASSIHKQESFSILKLKVDALKLIAKILVRAIFFIAIFIFISPILSYGLNAFE